MLTDKQHQETAQAIAKARSNRTPAQRLLESDGWFYRTPSLGTDEDGILFWFDGDQSIRLGLLVTSEDMVPEHCYTEFLAHLAEWSEMLKDS